MGRVHEPCADAHHGRQQSKEGFKGERVRPGRVDDGALALRTSLRRKVFDVDGLDQVVAAPIDGEATEHPRNAADVRAVPTCIRAAGHRKKSAMG